MSEVVDVGLIFFGLGGMVLLFVISYFFYQFARGFRIEADSEQKYGLLRDLILERVAKKRGINLQEEAVKRQLQKTKSFRKKLEEEMIQEMFGKEKKEDKK